MNKLRDTLIIWMSPIKYCIIPLTKKPLVFVITV